MKAEVKIPSMGESITEVVIGSILIQSGTHVKQDEAILEIETDKVNQVLYAPQPGILNLTVKSGDTVRVGQAIGYVDNSGEKTKPTQAVEEPKQDILKEEQKESGQELESIRQKKEDFLKNLKHEEQHQTTETRSPQQEVIIDNGKRESRRKMSNIRKVIAKRLVEAQHSAAMLTTFNEIDMSQVIELREKYKEAFQKKHNVKLGFMSFFVEASIAALKLFPDLNSYIDGDEIVHRNYYDIGVAVGTDKGLVVPVLRNCDQLSFAKIEAYIEDYAKKAKEGTLSINDLQGGCFTITNGGVYGSLLSTPILNPPQSGILGMHKIEKRPVVIDDQIVIRPMMYVALSYDHRIVDGKGAVSFLVALKNYLENPARMMLDV